MANVLITGGTGFIASHVARQLLGAGHRVVCFDNAVSPARLKIIGEKAIVRRGDVTQIEDLISACQEHEVDRIICLAFLMPLEAEKHLSLAVRINALGVNNAFEAARLCGIKRVVHASSISAYGHYSWYQDTPAKEIPEHFHPANNVYGAAKQFNEFMAGRYNQYHQMEIICLRTSIVFGYGRALGSTMWMDAMLSNPVLGKPAQVPRRASQKVSLIYVKDLADIFVALALAPAPRHRLYNSGRHTLNLGQFAQMVKKEIPTAQFQFDEAAEPFYLVHAVDDSRYTKEFKPKWLDLAENIRDQIAMVRQMEVPAP
jgi:nucleoside-diphosphate-sugar epimerase